MTILIETRLIKLLENASQNYYIDYINKISNLFKNSEFLGSGFYPIFSENNEKIGFRLKFDLPVFIMLSHPLCRFKISKSYPLKEKFFASLGIVPVFFPSLNRISVLKLWGHRTNEFFSESSQSIVDEIVCWKFPVASENLELSSMNLIEQNRSEPEYVSQYLNEIFEKQFRLMYWPMPSKGFSRNLHMVYDRSKINMFLKVSKSLYSIKKINSSEVITVENNPIETCNVTINALGERNGSFFVTEFETLIDNNLIDDIASNRMEDGILNGMITELKTPDHKKTSILALQADYSASYFDLIQELIGIIVSRRSVNSDEISYVGKYIEIKTEVYLLLSILQRHYKLSHTLSSDIEIEDIFEECIAYMAPLLFHDEEGLRLVHPMIWGFMDRWDMLSESNEKNVDIIKKVLKILDSEKSFTQIAISDECNVFTSLGKNKHEILRSLIHLKKTIKGLKKVDRIFN